MSIMENCRAQNLILQKKVQEEIENIKQGKSKRSIVQLQTILNELMNAENVQGLIFSFPRMIIDSWDYSDKLGMELMEYTDLYKKWK